MKITFNLSCIILLLQLSLYSKDTNPISQKLHTKGVEKNTMMMMCPNDTVYVNHAASGGNTGNSWADAYTSLSNALVMAHTCSNVKVVRVAGGTYLPQNKPFSGGVEIVTADARDRTFHLKDGLKIYGGYNASTGVRNINANPTILSGDYNTDDVVTGSGSTLTITNITENAYHVVLSTAPTSGALGVIIDGFTIKGGCANGTGSFTINGSVIIRNGGGGIAIYRGSNDVIANNLINNTGSAGAAFYSSLATIFITKSALILNNSLNSGGGIHSETSIVNLINTTIIGNRAANSGGATFINGGTGNFINSTFGGNHAAAFGGAFFLNGGSNHNLKNSIVYNNTLAGNILFGSFTTSNNNIFQGGITPCASCPNTNGNINPLFASTADVDGTDNFHRTVDDGFNVQSTSPAINAGTPTGAPTTDITDFTRTGNPDIGAYEYHVAAPPCTMTASITTNTPVSCNGGTNGSLTVTASNGTANYSYAWSNGATTMNTSSTTNTISSLGAGTYTVTVTDMSGCTASTSATVTQPIAIAPTATVTSNYNGAQISCFGATDGSLLASATGGTPGYTYAWSNGTTTASNMNLSAGSYTVTVTDANGCTATASATLIQPTAINPAATVSSNYNGAQISCFGATDGSISTAASGGSGSYSYLWSNGATTSNITNITAGTYGVTVTDINGCTGTASVTITQPAAVNPTTSVTNVSCFGGNNGSIDLTVSGGTGSYTYLWSNGSTNQDISSLSAGTYTVTVTDANGCSSTTSAMVTAPITANYTFIGPGSDFNVSTNWQGGCIPPLNDPTTIITINSGQTLNLNGNLTATIINNGTLTGTVNLTGDLINNGTTSPGN